MQQHILDKLGPTPLFLGVEDAGWTIPRFQDAAQAAKGLGVSSLLVKIADGTRLWYSVNGGWQRIVDAINASGVKAVPYTYCYGDKYGGLAGEIAILSAALRYSGIAVADMEAEFNGQVGWAQQFAAGLAPVPGILGVTSWGDPDLQNWQGVLNALKPCVDFWLPQVYSDYLASVYHAQYDPYGLPYFPVLNLGVDAGPNNIAHIAANANSPIIAFWEYEAAIGSYAPTVRAIVAGIASAQLTLTTTGENTDMPLQITDSFAATHFVEIATQPGETRIWQCKDNGYRIIGGMLDKYRETQGLLRLPLSNEIYVTLPNGKAISYQLFEGGPLVWDTQYAEDNPGQGPCYAGHLDQDKPWLQAYIKLAGLTTQSVVATPPAPAPTIDVTAATASLEAIVAAVQNVLADLKA